MAKRYESLVELVDRARTLPPEQQADFLRAACGADEQSYSDAIAHLGETHREWWETGAEDASAQHEPVSQYAEGALLGSYRIVRQIGSGGMGEVYLAERADQQFTHKVAIKIVKAGFVSRQVQTRLRLERQILATLDHPNIARLLDGGATPDGRPYIVMEYVEGVPIDDYCNAHELNLEQRLRLFQTVCSAVHAAHQNLIVHRDLKPSNILVNREGQPKLLDFGIAKLLDTRQVDQTLAVTHVDYRMMTPDHASPEQVQGLPVTTASDIYVLGVVLYELLTGCRPFDLRDKRFSEIERAICEEHPVPPSEAVASGAQTCAVRERTAVDVDRSFMSRKLAKRLAGDLDNIVLLAMRKEPERRYSSVEQFSADIERYLTGRPVLARPDTWSYRTSKFVRRHFLAVGFGAAFVALLIVSVIVSLMQASRIRAERDAVAAQRSRAEAVSSFLVDLFRVADPIEGENPDITARQLLERGAVSIASGVSNDPATESALQETIGRAYLNLGLNELAEPLLSRSLRTREQSVGVTHGDYASSLAALAELDRRNGEYARAEARVREAMSIEERASDAQSLASARHRRVLGNILFDVGKLGQAEQELRRSLDEHRRHLDAQDARLTLVMDDLANVLQMRGDLAGAEELYRRALEIDRNALGERHPQYAFHLHNLARILQIKGDLKTAESLYAQVIDVHRDVLGEAHPETVTALTNLAALLVARRDYERAEQYYRDALEIDRRSRGPRHINVGHDLAGLGSVAIARGDPKTAEAYFRDALSIFREKLPHDHVLVLTSASNLGRALNDQSRWSEAELLLRPSVEALQKQLGEAAPYTAIARTNFARAVAGQRRFAEAELHFKTSYSNLVANFGARSDVVARARTWITAFYDAWGRPERAATVLSAAEEGPPQ